MKILIVGQYKETEDFAKSLSSQVEQPLIYLRKDYPYVYDPSRIPGRQTSPDMFPVQFMNRSFVYHYAEMYNNVIVFSHGENAHTTDWYFDKIILLFPVGFDIEKYELPTEYTYHTTYLKTEQQLSQIVKICNLASKTRK